MLTQKKALQHGKPVVHFDMEKVTVGEGIDLLKAFILDNSVEALNVAGSRGSKDPDIYGKTFQVVEGSIVIFELFAHPSSE